MGVTNTEYRWTLSPARALAAGVALAALCGVSQPTWAITEANEAGGGRAYYHGIATKQGLTHKDRSRVGKFRDLAGRALRVAKERRDAFLATKGSTSGGEDQLLSQAQHSAIEFAKTAVHNAQAAGALMKPGDDRLAGQRHIIKGADGTPATCWTKLSGPGLREVLVTHRLPGGLSTMISFEPLAADKVRPGPSEALLIPKRRLNQQHAGGLKEVRDTVAANAALHGQVTSVVVRTPVKLGRGKTASLEALTNERTVEISVEDPVRGKQTQVFGVSPLEESAD